MAELKKTGFRVTFEDGETKTQYLQALSSCLCDRDITEEELKDIITQLRKKDDIKLVSQNVLDLKESGHTIHSAYNGIEKKTWVYKNEAGIFLAKWGSDGYYTIDTKKFVQKNKPEEYKLEKSKFDELGDTLFNSSRSERIQSSDANYKTFVEHLNCTFTTYKVNTCIRKIHFLAQSYHETGRFVHTYEGENAVTKPYGGKDFVGRGIKQITHDENYLACYDELEDAEYYKNSYKGKHKIGESIAEYLIRAPKNDLPKDIVKTLIKFAKKIATDLKYACYSAGFFWEFKNIYKYADADDVTGLTKKINGGSVGLENRKTYTKYLKEIFDYDNCKNKN